MTTRKYTHLALMALADTAQHTTIEKLMACIAFEFNAQHATWYKPMQASGTINVLIGNMEFFTLSDVKRWLSSAVTEAGWKRQRDVKWGTTVNSETSTPEFYVEAGGRKVCIWLTGTAKRASIRIEL